MPHTSFPRPALRALVAVAIVASLPGCAWFRSEPAYLEARESRPLEVPPDLVLPSSASALQIPPAAAGAPTPGEAPPAAFGVGAAFEVSDSLDSTFRRVGIALGRLEGVTATPVAALNSHEVTFKGETFLVRASAQGDAVRVDAISPEGQVLSAGAAAEVLAQLRARLH